jgi:hypothetical protein
VKALRGETGFWLSEYANIFYRSGKRFFCAGGV